MNKKKTILVIAAHPDDEVLGCGGTIARLSDEGHEVSIVILGEGITSRSTLGNDNNGDEKIKTLHQQSHQAARLLGAHAPKMFSLSDNRFDTVPLLDIAKIIESCIEETRPDCIFTHHQSDLNKDHEITNRATLIATRPVEQSCVQMVLSYEIPSSTDWAFGVTGPSFRPSVFIDVSDTLEKKIKAMAIYESESRPYPHPRSSQALRDGMNRWGSVAGLRAAEAFELIRSINRMDGDGFCPLL